MQNSHRFDFFDSPRNNVRVNTNTAVRNPTGYTNIDYSAPNVKDPFDKLLAYDTSVFKAEKAWRVFDEKIQKDRDKRETKFQESVIKGNFAQEKLLKEQTDLLKEIKNNGGGSSGGVFGILGDLAKLAAGLGAAYMAYKAINSGPGNGSSQTEPYGDRAQRWAGNGLKYGAMAAGGVLGARALGSMLNRGGQAIASRGYNRGVIVPNAKASFGQAALRTGGGALSFLGRGANLLGKVAGVGLIRAASIATGPVGLVLGAAYFLFEDSINQMIKEGVAKIANADVSGFIGRQVDAIGGFFKDNLNIDIPSLVKKASDIDISGFLSRQVDAIGSFFKDNLGIDLTGIVSRVSEINIYGYISRQVDAVGQFFRDNFTFEIPDGLKDSLKWISDKVNGLVGWFKDLRDYLSFMPDFGTPTKSTPGPSPSKPSGADSLAGGAGNDDLSSGASYTSSSNNSSTGRNLGSYSESDIKRLVISGIEDSFLGNLLNTAGGVINTAVRPAAVNVDPNTLINRPDSTGTYHTTNIPSTVTGFADYMRNKYIDNLTGRSIFETPIKEALVDGLTPILRGFRYIDPYGNRVVSSNSQVRVIGGQTAEMKNLYDTGDLKTAINTFYARDHAGTEMRDARERMNLNADATGQEGVAGFSNNRRGRKNRGNWWDTFKDPRKWQEFGFEASRLLGREMNDADIAEYYDIGMSQVYSNSWADTFRKVAAVLRLNERANRRNAATQAESDKTYSTFDTVVSANNSLASTNSANDNSNIVAFNINGADAVETKPDKQNEIKMSFDFQNALGDTGVFGMNPKYRNIGGSGAGEDPSKDDPFQRNDKGEIIGLKNSPTRKPEDFKGLGEIKPASPGTSQPSSLLGRIIGKFTSPDSWKMDRTGLFDNIINNVSNIGQGFSDAVKADVEKQERLMKEEEDRRKGLLSQGNYAPANQSVNIYLGYDAGGNPAFSYNTNGVGNQNVNVLGGAASSYTPGSSGNDTLPGNTPDSSKPLSFPPGTPTVRISPQNLRNAAIMAIKEGPGTDDAYLANTSVLLNRLYLSQQKGGKGLYGGTDINALLSAPSQFTTYNDYPDMFTKTYPDKEEAEIQRVIALIQQKASEGYFNQYSRNSVNFQNPGDSAVILNRGQPVNTKIGSGSAYHVYTSPAGTNIPDYRVVIDDSVVNSVMPPPVGPKSSGRSSSRASNSGSWYDWFKGKVQHFNPFGTAEAATINNDVLIGNSGEDDLRGGISVGGGSPDTLGGPSKAKSFLNSVFKGETDLRAIYAYDNSYGVDYIDYMAAIQDAKLSESDLIELKNITWIPPNLRKAVIASLKIFEVKPQITPASTGVPVSPLIPIIPRASEYTNTGDPIGTAVPIESIPLTRDASLVNPVQSSPFKLESVSGSSKADKFLDLVYNGSRDRFVIKTYDAANSSSNYMKMIADYGLTENDLKELKRKVWIPPNLRSAIVASLNLGNLPSEPEPLRLTVTPNNFGNENAAADPLRLTVTPSAKNAKNHNVISGSAFSGSGSNTPTSSVTAVVENRENKKRSDTIENAVTASATSGSLASDLLSTAVDHLGIIADNTASNAEASATTAGIFTEQTQEVKESASVGGTAAPGTLLSGATGTGSPVGPMMFTGLGNNTALTAKGYEFPDLSNPLVLASISDNIALAREMYSRGYKSEAIGGLVGHYTGSQDLGMAASYAVDKNWGKSIASLFGNKGLGGVAGNLIYAATENDWVGGVSGAVSSLFPNTVVGGIASLVGDIFGKKKKKKSEEQKRAERLAALYANMPFSDFTSMAVDAESETQARLGGIPIPGRSVLTSISNATSSASAFGDPGLTYTPGTNTANAVPVTIQDPITPTTNNVDVTLKVNSGDGAVYKTATDTTISAGNNTFGNLSGGNNVGNSGFSAKSSNISSPSSVSSDSSSNSVSNTGLNSALGNISGNISAGIDAVTSGLGAAVNGFSLSGALNSVGNALTSDLATGATSSAFSGFSSGLTGLVDSISNGTIGTDALSGLSSLANSAISGVTDLANQASTAVGGFLSDPMASISDIANEAWGDITSVPTDIANSVSGFVSDITNAASVGDVMGTVGGMLGLNGVIDDIENANIEGLATRAVELGLNAVAPGVGTVARGLIEGNITGATVGSAIGTALGAVFGGPVGAFVGGLLGSWVGDLISPEVDTVSGINAEQGFGLNTVSAQSLGFSSLSEMNAAVAAGDYSGLSIDASALGFGPSISTDLSGVMGIESATAQDPFGGINAVNAFGTSMTEAAMTGTMTDLNPGLNLSGVFGVMPSVSANASNKKSKRSSYGVDKTNYGYGNATSGTTSIGAKPGDPIDGTKSNWGLALSRALGITVDMEATKGGTTKNGGEFSGHSGGFGGIGSGPFGGHVGIGAGQVSTGEAAAAAHAGIGGVSAGGGGAGGGGAGGGGAGGGGAGGGGGPSHDGPSGGGGQSGKGSDNALGGFITEPVTFESISNSGYHGRISENEPEAVFPITRDAQGRLSVYSANSGSSGGDTSVDISAIIGAISRMEQLFNKMVSTMQTNIANNTSMQKSTKNINISNSSGQSGVSIDSIPFIHQDLGLVLINGALF